MASLIHLQFRRQPKKSTPTNPTFTKSTKEVYYSKLV